MLGRFGKLAVGGVALSLLAVAAVFVRAFHSESGVFKAQRHAVPLSDDARAIPGLAAVEFPSRDGHTMRGWYAPSRNGAAIVLTHGTGGDRRNALPETRELVAHGFGVLAYDFPGHGESEGDVRWGEGELASLSGALDFVAARADVNKGKLGVAGYSMGGLIAVRLAVNDQRVRALALLGTPPDVSEVIRLEYKRSLASSGALFALKHYGMTLERDQPLGLVSRFSPRELLIVGGEKDTLIPERMARDLFQAAHQPKEFYLVPGATHGGYFDAQPVEYCAKLAAFFTRALALPTL